MPIWVSDFVLAGFGTGAVVGVPGHDKRDFEFAQAVGLPVVRVVKTSDDDLSEISELSQVQEDDGVMVNSGFLDGMPVKRQLQPWWTTSRNRVGVSEQQRTSFVIGWLVANDTGALRFQ